MKAGLAGKYVYIPKYYPGQLKKIREDKLNALILKATRYLANGHDFTVNNLRTLMGVSVRMARKALAEAKRRIKELERKGLDPKEYYPF